MILTVCRFGKFKYSVSGTNWLFGQVYSCRTHDISWLTLMTCSNEVDFSLNFIEESKLAFGICYTTNLHVY